MQSPRSSHLDALLHTIKHISTSPSQGILLRSSNSLTLHAYSDSDWAACPMSRRSVTGYVLLFGDSHVS